MAGIRDANGIILNDFIFQLNHHNIVRMFESFVHEESFYIVMEYCEVSCTVLQIDWYEPYDLILDYLRRHVTQCKRAPRHGLLQKTVSLQY